MIQVRECHRAQTRFLRVLEKWKLKDTSIVRCRIGLAHDGSGRFRPRPAVRGGMVFTGPFGKRGLP
jgi:hypothetical protein